ncbi:MAG: glucuronate isomerase [Candidatus Solibacter usitatus]|nr:glucuronate isomerase [Candidatus Solibacter usitatus]
MPFIHDDFLLQTKASRRLYHEYAENEPILDYHCHLPPKDVAENRQFADLYEILLEGDHYKWRAMRANGVPERLISGDATNYEKFAAWAAAVPDTLRNPLYHWTHLELVRYFGIEDSMNASTAKSIWDRTNAQLATDDLRAWGIMKKFDVRVVCTTDDPVDDLSYHKSLAASALKTKIYPAYRPDKALTVHQPEIFNAWVAKLEAASNINIGNFQSFLDALQQRHDFFHAMGARLSDHGLTTAFGSATTQAEAAAVFQRAREGQAANVVEHDRFGSFLMLFFGRLDAQKGWTKQLHLGARRSNNAKMVGLLGPDTGFDSMGDWPQMDDLARYMDTLNSEGALPKMVLYNLNPSDNYAFATMVGNFQDGVTPGKIQFGSGWWFNDQKEAMEWQMNALSNCGLFSRFIGMLTDSRSFMSYPRHEYFRRVVCNMVGRDMENGELPDDFELVGGMIRRICFANARDYLGLAL